MKTLQKTFLFSAALILLFSVTACEKTSDEDLLTAHPWKFAKITADSDAEYATTTVALATAFLTGSEIIFNSNGTFVFTMPLSADPSTGTWQMPDKNTLKLTTTGAINDLFGGEVRITKLTKTSLVIETDESVSLGDQNLSYVLTITFMK